VRLFCFGQFVRLARQAHFLRRSIELEVVSTLATTADPVLITTLKASLNRQRVMLEAEDFMEFSLSDQAFHRQMYEAAEVPDLWPLVRRQSGHLDRVRRLHLPVPGKANAILQDHASIVEAIAKGDPVEAQKSLRQHLSGTLSIIEDIRTRFPSYLKG
jgi:DNA-binding GntR family transcriptional regulator